MTDTFIACMGGSSAEHTRGHDSHAHLPQLVGCPAVAGGGGLACCWELSRARRAAAALILLAHLWLLKPRQWKPDFLLTVMEDFSARTVTGRKVEMQMLAMLDSPSLVKWTPSLLDTSFRFVSLTTM